MCGKDEAVAVLSCFEEGPLREASPVEDVEVSGWMFEGLRFQRMYSRETALGLGVAICLHIVVPAMVVLFGLLFAVPSVSEPPVVTVSLVSLAGFGGSSGASGSPGASAAGAGGKNASRNPIKTAAVQKNAQRRPQKRFARRAKAAERIMARRSIDTRKRRKMAARAPAPTVALSLRAAHHRDAASGVSFDGPACAAGGNRLPGAEGAGVPGGGTGSGGVESKQVDTPPMPIKKVEPEFPDEARQMGISGRVVLRFLVEADGRVARASVIAARPGGVFNQSALEAIGQWRFRPGLYRGKPVAVWVELPVRFRLAR